MFFIVLVLVNYNNHIKKGFLHKNSCSLTLQIIFHHLSDSDN